MLYSCMLGLDGRGGGWWETARVTGTGYFEASWTRGFKFVCFIGKGIFLARFSWLLVSGALH